MNEIGILKVEEKTYINKDTGVAYIYLQSFVELDGEKIILVPLKNQKDIYKYLLKKQYNKEI